MKTLLAALMLLSACGSAVESTLTADSCSGGPCDSSQEGVKLCCTPGNLGEPVEPGTSHFAVCEQTPEGWVFVSSMPTAATYNPRYDPIECAPTNPATATPAGT